MRVFHKIMLILPQTQSNMVMSSFQTPDSAHANPFYANPSSLFPYSWASLHLLKLCNAQFPQTKYCRMTSTWLSSDLNFLYDSSSTPVSSITCSVIPIAITKHWLHLIVTAMIINAQFVTALCLIICCLLQNKLILFSHLTFFFDSSSINVDLSLNRWFWHIKNVKNMSTKGFVMIDTSWCACIKCHQIFAYDQHKKRKHFLWWVFLQITFLYATSFLFACLHDWLGMGHSWWEIELLR